MAAEVEIDGPPVEASDSEPEPVADGPRHLHRPYLLASAIAIAASVAAFAWLVTSGTWNFFQTGVVSDFYDAQARALMHGHWYVPASVATIEGIVEHHRTYLYYGPVPAVLRMPVLAFTNRLDGRLTQLSMLLAFTVALVFVAHLSWRMRRLVAGDRPVRAGEAVAAGLIVLGIGLGSQLFWLGTDPVVYYEAELWGAALALGAFDFVLGFIARPALRTGLLAGVFATLAILTRGSVGAGPVAALGLLALAHAAVAVRRRFKGSGGGPDWLGLSGEGRTWTVLLGLSALVPVAAYAAVNEAKFGTLFGLPLAQQVWTHMSAHRRAVLASNGGSYFSIRYVPTALVQYLRPDALNLNRLALFFGFPGPATVIGHVVYDDRDFTSSVTASMPALALTGLVGLVGVFRPRRRHGSGGRLALLRVPLVGAAAGTIGVLTIAFIANRYLADFMPGLVLASLAGFHLLIAALRRRTAVTRAAAVTALALLGVFGILVNTSLALVYQRVLRPGVPLAQRASYVAWQQSLDSHLFGGRPTGVEQVPSLGRPTAPGDLAVVGHCSALYQSTGSGWAAVERSQSAGHFRLAVQFPASSPAGHWPLLVNGIRHGSSYLTVQPVGGGRYRVAYLFEGFGSWITGQTFPARPGVRYVVDAVFDSRVHEVSVSVDGTVVFDVGFFVRGDRPVYVGRNPFGGPALARWPGSLRRLRVTTPICDGLLQRMRR